MKASTEAIALVYDGAQAPTVSAKGEDELAQEIIRLAMEHEVPIYQNADLARMLVQLELGDQIPVELYRTIAEIIAFAWYLKGKAPPGFNPEDKAVQALQLESPQHPRD
ncbi:EscU/YscU/HrcU family type III secretion system export apparatus switch protein [Halopseudomonas yangmingensis]|jgi:flagellar biosynthesis protein|uniref:Flagellar biosynthetic protein FlhB n=1 Tax=Halopseudomonas yangmingensis TaxID=1720063 RepID=A0A1I4NEF1_9GAMM|nr:EscU/YscU/HrcU family type III secretion system export apparatus switch protein [Halopseudomonas yangmingensis]SFM13942.1 flagellar biosynthesis protein [Halopseudomonas yangmingensis]